LEKDVILVVDDLGLESCTSAEISNIFTRKSHHNLISIILIWQNIFNPGKFARTIALNSEYLVLFKNCRDKSSINYLARQFSPTNSNFLINSFNHATMNAHSSLFLDFRQKTEEEIRVRSNIFDSISIVYTQ